MAQVPIIKPGAPGDPARELSAKEAIKIADTSYSPADAQFMQDMIPHHHQALEMAALVADRTNRPELIDVAGRINVSQGDEIEFMLQWLRERGEQVPDPAAHEAMHTDHTMAGMATPEQMAELAQSEGTAFDGAVPDVDDHPPRGRGDDGRGPARTAGFSVRPGAVRVHDERHQ